MVDVHPWLSVSASKMFELQLVIVSVAPAFETSQGLVCCGGVPVASAKEETPNVTFPHVTSLVHGL